MSALPGQLVDTLLPRLLDQMLVSWSIAQILQWIFRRKLNLVLKARSLGQLMVGRFGVNAG